MIYKKIPLCNLMVKTRSRNPVKWSSLNKLIQFDLKFQLMLNKWMTLNKCCNTFQSRLNPKHRNIVQQFIVLKIRISFATKNKFFSHTCNKTRLSMKSHFMYLEKQQEDVTKISCY